MNKRNNKVLVDKIGKKINLKKKKLSPSELCRPGLISQTCNPLNYKFELN